MITINARGRAQGVTSTLVRHGIHTHSLTDLVTNKPHVVRMGPYDAPFACLLGSVQALQGRLDCRARLLLFYRPILDASNLIGWS